MGSDSLLTWVRDTAQAHDLGFHLHIDETLDEVTEEAARLCAIFVALFVVLRRRAWEGGLKT